MAKTDLSEINKAIGDILSGDTTLTNMLGQTPGVIYEETDVPADLSFPVVRFYLVGEGPDTRIVEPGKFRPRLQLDAVGTNQSKNRAIIARADELLTVPYHRAEGISTSNFLVTVLRRVNTTPLETPLTKDGRKVVQLSSDWNMNVRPKGG